MSDSTFKIVKEADTRSDEYEKYRKEWDRREVELDCGLVPVNVDLELSARCDLRCGATDENPDGFCQIHLFEAIRTKGFKDKHSYTPGFMSPTLFDMLTYDAHFYGVQAVKLNYRGESSLHPEIVDFVSQASKLFPDILLNTNGNGGARKDPDLFAKIVEAGITNLLFSVDAASPEIYEKQRVGGDWNILLNSVKTAIEAKKSAGSSDCRIRASVVRTSLNKDEVDSGRMQDFWVGEMGVDWLSVNNVYYPAGVSHPWGVGTWTPNYNYTCPDPFRRMIITWDGKHTLPCCHSFPLEIDAGPVLDCDILVPWHSPQFAKLRNAHITKNSHNIHLCSTCPLAHTYRDK